MLNNIDHNKEVLLKMAKDSGNNLHSFAYVNKVSVSVGLGANKESKEIISSIEKELSELTGQKPKYTRAKKSIAGFKIRENQHIGFVVTLRGKRMWQFIDKINKAVLPRVRDFEGIDEKSIDSSGNLNFSIKEHIVFPEIVHDQTKSQWGMSITLTLNKKSKRNYAKTYYEKIGFILKGGQNG